MKSASILRMIVAGGLIVAGSACASHGRTYEQSSGGEVELSDVIPVQVVNDNYSDVTVYAVVNGVARRLGMVTGNSKATFSVRASQIPAGQVRFIGEPIGGTGRASSGVLSVGRGSTVVFNIAPALEQSMGSVR